MEREMIRIPVADIRGVLQELCAYIPYFEERVGGTFKSRYRNGTICEMADPVFDESFVRFKQIYVGGICDKFSCCDLHGRFGRTKMSAWHSPEDKLGWLLFQLGFAIIHERLCTGYTAICMRNGTYLRLLKHMEEVLAEMPADAVLTYPATRRPEP